MQWSVVTWCPSPGHWPLVTTGPGRRHWPIVTRVTSPGGQPVDNAWLPLVSSHHRGGQSANSSPPSHTQGLYSYSQSHSQVIQVTDVQHSDNNLLERIKMNQKICLHAEYQCTHVQMLHILHNAHSLSPRYHEMLSGAGLILSSRQCLGQAACAALQSRLQAAVCWLGQQDHNYQAPGDTFYRGPHQNRSKSSYEGYQALWLWRLM